MRVAVDYRTAGKAAYQHFRKTHPEIKIAFDDWKAIIYGFNEEFRTYILETGEKARMPGGFGDFSINKKKRKKFKLDPRTGKEYINLPIDWKKTHEKGKVIYNLNHHTDGNFFGWLWFKKKTTRLKNSDLWYFKPTRTSSRLIAHYVKIDKKYQHLYNTWKV